MNWTWNDQGYTKQFYRGSLLHSDDVLIREDFKGSILRPRTPGDNGHIISAIIQRIAQVLR